MSKLTQKEKILADVDDELWLLKKRIELKYSLSWEEARNLTNESIARLCCDCWNERGDYGCGNK